VLVAHIALCLPIPVLACLLAEERGAVFADFANLLRLLIWEEKRETSV
jgi:hypothetical protein